MREANYNTRTLKFNNFPEFQNVISNSPSLTHERHYDALGTKIDMWLYSLFIYYLFHLHIFCR